MKRSKKNWLQRIYGMQTNVTPKDNAVQTIKARRSCATEHDFEMQIEASGYGS
jgi:hypothetical protein